jgi:hypothetical protein
MRLTTCLFLIAASLPLAGMDAAAQSQRLPPGYQQGYPPPVEGGRSRAYPPGYYPGMMIQRAPPQQQPPGFSLRRLFGVPDDPSQQAQPAPRRRAPVARPARPRPRPTPPVAVARQEKPKPQATTQILVFGDSLASALGLGIDAIYEDSEDVGVVRKTRTEGGLVRGDVDWAKVVKDSLDSGQKGAVAVVMLGANDRQPIRVGGKTLEPLSDEWQQAYRSRVEALLAVLKERNLPVVWVGLPPMKSEKVSEDLIAINDILREAVERTGGAYVDIWPGFVDEDNHYTPTGPDVDGQPARLRAEDGVAFTAAGARKIAHFANEEIKRIVGTGTSPETPAVAAIPGQPAPLEGEAPTTETLAPLEDGLPTPEPAAVPVLPVKPEIGPVLPLTASATSPGGALVAKPPRLDGDKGYPIRKALREGAPPTPQPGRADDYTWPPKS